MNLAVFLASLAGSLVTLALWPRRQETLEEWTRRRIRERRRARRPADRAP